MSLFHLHLCRNTLTCYFLFLFLRLSFVNLLFLFPCLWLLFLSLSPPKSISLFSYTLVDLSRVISENWRQFQIGQLFLQIALCNLQKTKDKRRRRSSWKSGERLKCAQDRLCFVVTPKKGSSRGSCAIVFSWKCGTNRFRSSYQSRATFGAESTWMGETLWTMSQRI